MTTVDKIFAGSIPELYDRFLVPLIFDSYARDLASRIAATRPADILETAAGTGVLTRANASVLRAEARIVATDLNQPMLDRARQQQPQDRSIEWKQADALALPFGNESFDVVACQFGAMFFPDKIKGYREAWRVLRAGGHFFCSVWDRISENDFADVTTEALAGLYPQDPPRFLARTPHGYHDVDEIRRDFAAAGFADISIDAVPARSKAPSPRDPAIAYCQGTPLRTEIEARDPSGLERATDVATQALASRFGDGAVDGRIRALIVTATR
ncbi:MAG TPA: methyltransferase domain-containing protein [Pseudolabrys sp.]|nr:methyltransferase domain-containing protein [Pseudolabrys sp.]